MIDAVIMFGALNVLFEFTLLAMLPPKTRLRILGSTAKCRALHFGMLMANIIIHWGTLIGTMSGIFAFICSIATVSVAKLAFGQITGTTYKRGILGYSVEELR